MTEDTFQRNPRSDLGFFENSLPKDTKMLSIAKIPSKPALHNMKSKLLFSSLLLSVTQIGAYAAEVTLVDWGHTWKYFHPQSDDPSLDDATIDNSGIGVAPNTGPDLIHPGFNTGISAWFAKESDFTATGGYEDMFGRGFNIDGTQVGVVSTATTGNFSSYDGGQGPGPFGYDAIVYFGRTDIAPEMLAFGTALTKTPATRRFASYYRTTFTAAQDFTKPRIRMLLDDNAVIYYDGVAVARVNRYNSPLPITTPRPRPLTRGLPITRRD